VSSGYSILTKSADAGVDVFVKLQKKSLFVFFQGHPEYEAQSLLGEYRRDIGRFLRREIEAYPAMPKGYFDDQAEELLTDFRKFALSNRRNELLTRFPVDQVAANLKNTWHSAATRIYRNWILYMSAQRTRELEIPCSTMTTSSAISYWQTT
jgi:homoserine O-succinyltransferase